MDQGLVVARALLASEGLVAPSPGLLVQPEISLSRTGRLVLLPPEVLSGLRRWMATTLDVLQPANE